MSSTLEHYNMLLPRAWHEQNLVPIYQPSCLINDYDGHCWPINFPHVNQWKNKIVILHCQDFLSVQNGSCPELELIEQYYGDTASQVAVVHWNIGLDKVYNGPLQLYYFPTHSYELLGNLHASKQSWIDNFSYTRKTAWQCLNGIPRSHRKSVVGYLQKNFNNGIISLGKIVPLETDPYENYRGCENEVNWMRLQSVYSQCAINIVTETLYNNAPGIISEKTLMAFLAQQIPIVIGYAGIVEDCERLGFDMFRDIVDTSYDTEPNEIRWFNALNSNKLLLQNGIDLNVLQHRLQYNLKLALSLPDMWVKNYFAEVSRVSANFLNLDTDAP